MHYFPVKLAIMNKESGEKSDDNNGGTYTIVISILAVISTTVIIICVYLVMKAMKRKCRR